MSTATTATHVSLTRREGVAWIKLDGQASRNALDENSVAELVTICEDVDADQSVGAAIITGLHGAFCSGAARHILAGLSDALAHEAYERLGVLYSGFDRFRRLTVPTIALVDGAAVGAGLNLALVADLRIASQSARFISGFSPNGIHVGGGHFHLLEEAAGRQTAAALGLFTQTLNAAEAQAAGVVWQIVSPDEMEKFVADATTPLAQDPALARSLKSSFKLTTSSVEQWASATEVERARQMWSLTRIRNR